MIRFPCRCGHVFEMPDDTAGDDVQCPSCGLLNDVPLHNQLGSLTPDGIYKVDDSAPADPDALDTMIETFGVSRQDGNAVDQRNAPESLETVGEADTEETQKRRERPRYDPETGERIDAIPLAEENSPKIAERAVPVVPTAVAVTYAANDTPGPPTFRHVLEALLRPVNLVVMAFIFGVYVAAGVSAGITLCGIFILAPGVLAMVAGILAHYGDVLDDIGPQGQDELPRPLRDFELWEDMMLPLFAIFSATAVCFGPAMIAVASPLPIAAGIVLAIPLALVGLYFYPAVFLITQTSGSLANLLPARVLKVIGIIEQPRYVRIVALFATTILAHAWLIVGVIEVGWRMVHQPLLDLPNWTISVPVLLTMACIGQFTMHLFCWTLGLTYRHYHGRFEWLGQVYVPEEKPPVPRRKPRYVSAPPVE